MILSISFFAADHGIDLALFRLLRKVGAEAQHLAFRRSMRRLARGLLAPVEPGKQVLFRLRFGRPHLLVERVDDAVDVRPQPAQVAHRHRFVIHQNGEEHILRPHARAGAVVLERELAGLFKHPLRAGRIAAHFQALVERPHEYDPVIGFFHARLSENFTRLAVGHVQKPEQKMFAADVVAPIVFGRLRRELESLLQVRRKIFFKFVHGPFYSVVMVGRDMHPKKSWAGAVCAQKVMAGRGMRP